MDKSDVSLTQGLEHGNTIKLYNGMIFNFYMYLGLPQMTGVNCENLIIVNCEFF